MKNNIQNRQAESLKRTKKPGRPRKTAKTPEPQPARWDTTGRLVCPHCGAKGMRRDGQMREKDGKLMAPLLCLSCGKRSDVQWLIHPHQ